MTPNLYGKLLHILGTRGITPTPSDLTLIDLVDGIGPRIAMWNTARLGAQPTQAEIDGVTDAQALAAITQTIRSKELALRALKALATAVHKRFKVFVPADTVTAAQWQQQLEAEWDALA